jgi:DNA-binding NtrC family response regulator
MDEPLRDLVVDDDSSIRNIVQEALSDGGFEPKAASSGEEAIALLNVHSYRVVIIDIVSGKDQVKGGRCQACQDIHMRYVHRCCTITMENSCARGSVT